MTLLLNQEEVRRVLNAGDCLEVMEEAYRELAESRAVNRPTTHAYLPHSLPDATFSFKSVEGGVKKFGVLALRITSDIVQEQTYKNTVRLEKLPLAGTGKFLGLIELFSVETGELLAIMPDGLIQQTRVAATSALAARVLCRRGAKTLAMLGSGGQARAHLRFFAAVLPIEKARVFSPNPEHRKSFVQEMEKEVPVKLQALDSAGEAVRGSDLVCSATNASRPVMDSAWLKPGMHYNAIREFEIEESIFEKCDVIAIHTRFGGVHHYLPPGLKEDLPAIRREKDRDWGRYPEIGDLLAGRAAGRTSDSEITFFLNNIGTGVQFAAIGHAVYRKAKKEGLGRELPTDWFLQDIKP